MGEFVAATVFGTACKLYDAVKDSENSLRFDVKKGQEVKSWIIDFKGGPKIWECTGKKDKANCTISLKDEDFVDLISQKSDPQSMFLSGKIKIAGDLMVAMQLTELQNAIPKGGVLPSKL